MVGTTGGYYLASQKPSVFGPEGGNFWIIAVEFVILVLCGAGGGLAHVSTSRFSERLTAIDLF